MAMFFFTMGQGSAACYTSAISCNLKNFSKNASGRIVGILLGLFGISAAIYSAIFTYAFKKDISSYLWFASGTTLVVPLAGVIFLNNIPKEPTRYDVTTPTENLAIDLVTTPEATPQEPVIAQPEPVTQTDVNPLETLRSLDFWLAFVSLFTGIGTGLVIINNLGNITISYGGIDGSQTVFVVMINLSNSFGRAFFGWISDRYVTRISRITWLSIALLCMATAQFGFAFAEIPYFYPLVILAGIAYGAMWMVMSAFTKDRFGLKYYGINFSLIECAPTAGSFLLSTLLAAYFYQSNVDHGSKTCTGHKCYFSTFLISCVLCTLGFAVSLLLIYRTRHLYRSK
jgi:MFS family permease